MFRSSVRQNISWKERDKHNINGFYTWSSIGWCEEYVIISHRNICR